MGQRSSSNISIGDVLLPFYNVSARQRDVAVMGNEFATDVVLLSRHPLTIERENY